MNLDKRTLKEYIRHLIRSVIFWILAMAFFALLRYYAIADETGVEIPVVYQELYDLPTMIFFFGLGGAFVGILYATIEFYIEKKVLKRVAIGWNMVIQVLLVSLSVVIVSELMLQLVATTTSYPLEQQLGRWYSDRSFYPVFFYVPVAALVFSMWVILSEKFGSQDFFKLLIGHYKTPREEWRIFMFLDLTGSTTIAEQIGHLKFSQLLQDCFYDLNELVNQYEAEIYQYVGDEAILSWSYPKGIYNDNCLAIFFAFQAKIKAKSAEYLSKYNLIPSFKAGIHGGKVMATEIGLVKKELAYHGDVVNTASRIQGACNQYRVPLLISEKLMMDLTPNQKFDHQVMGKVLLKGKQKEVEIHTSFLKKQISKMPNKLNLSTVHLGMNL